MASAEGVRPATFCQSTTCTVPRRPSLRWPRTATRVTIQSRERICSMPRSTTTTVDTVELFEFGIGHPDPGVEYLSEHQHLAGTLGEPTQRYVGGGERHRVRLDGGHSQDRDENPSAGEQFDDEAEYARLLPDDADADDDVADPAQRLAVGAQDHQPREPGCVHPVNRRHASKGRSESVDNAYRPRRTCLSVPGSSRKMIEKAKGLPADEVFLDLEDAVAADAKAAARSTVAAALAEAGWAGQLRGVRVNDWTTPWTHADIIEVVEGAGAALDVVVLPKVTDVSHVQALDLLLTQLETTHGLQIGRIGIDAQIEDARGLANIGAIAAHPRVHALVLGPADMIASLNMRTLVVGEQPSGYDVGDAYHHILMTILVAARVHGIAAIDGPYLKVRDVDAFRRVAGRVAALGYDGKWVLHPDQIAAGNEIFSPRQEDYDHAELILEAYEWHTSIAGGARGAVMLGDEMIDEASRKMALVISAKGRAAGMTRQADPFRPPD